MGSDERKDTFALGDEMPQHKVVLAEYLIGKYPVTSAQYRAFVQAAGHRKPDHWSQGAIPPGKEQHPVVNVSWDDAMAFCQWASQASGRVVRLPSEAAWEKAARGVDGHIWPWGDRPPDETRCNFADNIKDTTPVGQYSPQGDSPYGCADMAGNVWEWTSSIYKGYPYDAEDGREGLESRAHRRVVRGGSFAFPGRARGAFRRGYFPGKWDGFYGFRVVVSPF